MEWELILLERHKKYSSKHGYYEATRMVMKQAINRGLLEYPKNLICIGCGNKAHCYDHRDYSKPFDVQPVCRFCNAQKGRGENRFTFPLTNC